MIKNLLASIILSASVSTPIYALGLASDEGVRDPEISGPAWSEPGAWRTKVQQVFDPATRTLSRRMYTILDLEPSRDLDFVWSPDQASADKPGKITGKGHLVWRIKGRPTYDPSSVFAEYRGSLRDGLIEGRGTYLGHHGLWYEGEWKTGRMHGHGTLKLPGGDEYVGQFRAGKANGAGRYVDVTGEIYEGPFVDGRRQGSGRTTLPNGRSYESLWANGREAETSRFIRLAQGPGVPLPGGADDIRIGITVDKKLPTSSRTEDPDLRTGDFWYEVSNGDKGLSIRPANKRLMSIWKNGGEIQLLPREENKNFDNFGVVSLVKGQLVPLNLTLEVQNRSTSQAGISGLFIDVSSSASDLQPAIQMSKLSAFDTSMGGDTYYQPYVFVENFGWSAAKEAKLRFAYSKASTKPTTFPETLSLGSIDKTAKADFETHLQSAGVNLDVLKANSTDGFRCSSTSDRSKCLRQIKAKGGFGSLTDFLFLDDADLVVRIVGILDYTWDDNTGKERKASSPFSIKLPLGVLKQDLEVGEGGSREIVTRKAQQLKLDAASYRIPVTFATTLAPGRTSRLILPIDAEKSSVHDFKIIVQLSDGREIKSRPINLQFYRPKYFADTVFAKTKEDNESSRENYDLVGHDLRQIRNTEEYTCEATCKAESSCQAYTFDNWNKWCFLKSSADLLRFDPQYKSNILKGPSQPSSSTEPKVFERYRDKGFPGFGYLIEDSTDYGLCQKRCENEATCVAFTFNKQTSACYLFEDTTQPYSANAATDSGVKRQPAK
jgi:hypothetical protein